MIDSIALLIIGSKLTSVNLIGSVFALLVSGSDVGCLPSRQEMVECEGQAKEPRLVRTLSTFLDEREREGNCIHYFRGKHRVKIFSLVSMSQLSGYLR